MPTIRAMGDTMIITGDARSVLADVPDNSIDAVVTDPPYGLSKKPDALEVLRRWLAGDDYEHTGGGFMGKTWDSFVPGPSIWREVLRVLKPGGHACVFAGSRTVDLMGLALRIAGFEIRDQLQWLYGTGFPKSLDVSKAIDSRPGVQNLRDFSAHLKARRKALGLSRQDVSERVVGKRTGACWNWEHHQFPAARWWPALSSLLRLDARWGEIIAEAERAKVGERRATQLAFAPGQGSDHSGVSLDITAPATDAAKRWSGWGTALKPAHEPIILARKPLAGTVAANVLEHSTGGINVDGCRVGNFAGGPSSDHVGRWPANVILDPEAGALLGPEARFFYCAKASKAEREAGLEGFRKAGAGELTGGRAEGSAGLDNPRAGAGRKSKGRANIHPTVKPISLMRWLVRLVTPPGGTVLDPFAGSGSTGCAAALEGFRFLGIELSDDYAEIARARIAHHEPHDARLAEGEEPARCGS